MSGFIRLWRSVRGKDFYREKPFDNFRAWVDLLMEANFADKADKFGELVRRGELHTSEQALAERWGWTKSKVHRFLTNLESESQIESLANRKRTKIRITNYEQYQSVNLTGESPRESKTNRKPNHGSNTTERTLTKERKKKVNTVPQSDQLSLVVGDSLPAIPDTTHDLAPVMFQDSDNGDTLHTKHLRMTAAERDGLLAKFGPAAFHSDVAAADDWLANNPKRLRELKDHAAFMRQWMRRAKPVLQGSRNAALPMSKAEAKQKREREAMRRVCDAFENTTTEQDQSAALLKLLGGAR